MTLFFQMWRNKKIIQVKIKLAIYSYDSFIKTLPTKSIFSSLQCMYFSILLFYWFKVNKHLYKIPSMKAMVGYGMSTCLWDFLKMSFLWGEHLCRPFPQWQQRRSLAKWSLRPPSNLQYVHFGLSANIWYLWDKSKSHTCTRRHAICSIWQTASQVVPFLSVHLCTNINTQVFCEDFVEKNKSMVMHYFPLDLGENDH